jgi:hypothetical protein
MSLVAFEVIALLSFDRLVVDTVTTHEVIQWPIERRTKRQR